MPHGKRASSGSCPIYGSGGGSTSRLPEAQSGWAAAPTFCSGPPPQLMSWISRGLSWGPAKDVPILQCRIRDLFEGDFNMVAVIQVMLVRQVQPCKRHPLCLWEFNPEGPRAIQSLPGLTHEEMYK